MKALPSPAVVRSRANPNVARFDRASMKPTEIATEQLSNIIAQVIKGHISEKDANTQALLVVLELKMALTSDIYC